MALSPSSKSSSVRVAEAESAFEGVVPYSVHWQIAREAAEQRAPWRLLTGDWDLEAVNLARVSMCRD